MVDIDFYRGFKDILTDILESVKDLVVTLDTVIEEVRLLRSDQIDVLIKEVRELRKSVEAFDYEGPQ